MTEYTEDQCEGWSVLKRMRHLYDWVKEKVGMTEEKVDNLEERVVNIEEHGVGEKDDVISGRIDTVESGNFSEERLVLRQRQGADVQMGSLKIAQTEEGVTQDMTALVNGEALVDYVEAHGGGGGGGVDLQHGTLSVNNADGVNDTGYYWVLVCEVEAQGKTVMHRLVPSNTQYADRIANGYLSIAVYTVKSTDTVLINALGVEAGKKYLFVRDLDVTDNPSLVATKERGLIASWYKIGDDATHPTSVLPLMDGGVVTYMTKGGSGGGEVKIRYEQRSGVQLLYTTNVNDTGLKGLIGGLPLAPNERLEEIRVWVDRSDSEHPKRMPMVVHQERNNATDNVNVDAYFIEDAPITWNEYGYYSIDYVVAIYE